MDAVRAVLFDLDDTLTASNEFAADVLSAAAAAHGVSLTAEAIRSHRGAVYVPLMQDVYGVPHPTALAIYDTYRARYESMMRGRLEPTAGAGALLTALVAQGVSLALVTNKSESLAAAVLNLFGWRDAFAAIIGNDSSANHKPHPDPALLALSRLDCAPQHAAFLGDSVTDMACARAAEVATRIGLVGITPAHELTEAGATYVCHNLGEVAMLLVPDDAAAAMR